jgi:zinc and cadmium transporter
MTHLRTQLLMSFVGGLMLGIAMLHMLPHAVNLLGSASRTCAAVLIGIIAMFVLLRAFHTHQHGPATCGKEEEEEQHQECEHDHDHPRPPSTKGLGWLGMLFGLSLHTMMDGVALAASVVAEAGHAAWLGLAGLGTFLAVALHEPLDAFSITSVMTKGGWSSYQRTLVNLMFALTCPIGAMLFYFGTVQLADNATLLGLGLATSAGFFICISLADLLPEVSFHDHDRLKLTTALLLGVALAVGIENLPGHTHQGDTPGGQSQEVRDH